MRRNPGRKVFLSAALMTAASVVTSQTCANAQFSVGEIGAASSMSGTLSSMGGSSVSPQRVTRNLPTAPRDGSDAAFDPSGMGGFGGGAMPNFPDVANRSGANRGANRGGANGAIAAAPVLIKPFHWTDMRGADYLNELRGRPTRRSNSRARGVRNNPRRPLAKYKVPPRNWLSFYLPQDRYKITLNIWRYVSIEDDRGRYPVRYYYQPNSPTFLSLLASAPRSIVRPFRIIGFASWQDAMIAGYRPDPVSKPEPAARVLALGRLSESASVMRYIEAIYAGQISSAALSSGLDYTQNLARIVGSRRDTRAQVRPVVAQAVSALLGERDFPTSVTGTPVRVVRRVVIPVSAPAAGSTTAPRGIPSGFAGRPGGPASRPGGNPGAPPNFSGPDGGARAAEFYRFRSNAAGLGAR